MLTRTNVTTPNIDTNRNKQVIEKLNALLNENNLRKRQASTIQELVEIQMKNIWVDYAFHQCYLAPNIPEEALVHALSYFCSYGDKAQNLLAMIDTTPFGKGKNGIVFLDNRIILKAYLDSPKEIYYDEFENYRDFTFHCHKRKVEFPEMLINAINHEALNSFMQEAARILSKSPY